MRRTVARAAPLLLLAACAGPPRPEGPAPTWDELRSATYAGIGPETVALRDGRWVGEPSDPEGASRPSVTLVDGLRLEGDLDGDGAPEAVVLLASTGGGSGTFVHLAVVERRAGRVASRAIALVGDRVQVRSGRLDGDRVVLDLLQTGPNDAACCPTEKARREWRMENGALVEGEALATGPISVLDLVGPEWVLLGFDSGGDVPESPEVTLTFEAEQIGGSAGCNRYFGALAPAGERGTDLAFGPIGATRMACPEPAMSLEDRYLGALGAVTSFGFTPGRLVLRWVRGEEHGALLFERR